jgi:hypothetical protein
MHVQGSWDVDRISAATRSFVNVIYWALDNWYWAQKMEMFTIADTTTVNRFRVAAWFTSVLLAFHPAIQAVSTAVLRLMA